MKNVNYIEKELVSVIIPTYNRANLLPRAIESVLKQTYQAFELIIVDDGSTDNTEKIIKHYSDPRIRYIKFKENRGQSAVMNEGVIASKGKYITFLDDDDEFFPQALEIKVKALKNTAEKIGFVYGLGIILRNGKISFFNKKRYQKKADLFKAQLQFCALPLVGALIKRECFKKVGLIDENLFFGKDWEFMLRLLKKYDYKHIDQAVYKAHYDDTSNISHICENSTRIIPRRLNTYKTFLLNHIAEIKGYRKILGKYYFRIAQILYHVKKFSLSKRYFKLAFQKNPTNLRYFFYFTIVQFKNKMYSFYLFERFIFQKLGKNILPRD